MSPGLGSGGFFLYLVDFVKSRIKSHIKRAPKLFNRDLFKRIAPGPIFVSPINADVHQPEARKGKAHFDHQLVVVFLFHPSRAVV